MPVRILHLLTLAGLGGTEHSILPLLRKMDAGRFTNEIAVLRGRGPMSGRWEAAGLPVTHLNLRRAGSPLALWRLARLFRRRRYDAVTLYGVAVNVWGRIAARCAGRPKVVGVIRGLSNERTVHPLRIWADRATFPLADCYVSNSRFAVDYLTRAGFPREKLRHVPTGLSCAPFDEAPGRQEARRRLGIGDDGPPVLICLGNLRPVKNHPLLLRACRILRHRGVGFSLLLVGAGPEEAELRRQAGALSLGDHVRFLGEREDVPAVLAASDGLVLPSLWEGLPRSIMEAMAARLPVVATDVGGVGELVLEGETGFLVPSGDAAALADRLADLLADAGLRERLGEAGRRRVEACFSEERMAESMEKVYEAILGTPNPL